MLNYFFFRNYRFTLWAIWFELGRQRKSHPQLAAKIVKITEFWNGFTLAYSSMNIIYQFLAWRINRVILDLDDSTVPTSWLHVVCALTCTRTRGDNNHFGLFSARRVVTGDPLASPTYSICEIVVNKGSKKNWAHQKTLRTYKFLFRNARISKSVTPFIVPWRYSG